MNTSVNTGIFPLQIPWNPTPYPIREARRGKTWGCWPPGAHLGCQHHATSETRESPQFSEILRNIPPAYCHGNITDIALNDGRFSTSPNDCPQPTGRRRRHALHTLSEAGGVGRPRCVPVGPYLLLSLALGRNRLQSRREKVDSIHEDTVPVSLFLFFEADDLNMAAAGVGAHGRRTCRSRGARSERVYGGRCAGVGRFGSDRKLDTGNRDIQWRGDIKCQMVPEQLMHREWLLLVPYTVVTRLQWRRLSFRTLLQDKFKRV